MLQRGDGADGRDDATGEEIAGEAEIPQHFERRQGGKLQFSDEVEAVECDGDDGAGVVFAGDPVPAGGEPVGIDDGSVPRSRHGA